jgi:hypothetical protein
VIAEEKRQLLRWVALAQQELPALSQPAANLKPANNAKKIPPEVDKLVKIVASGPALLLSREASSLAPSVDIEAPITQVFPSTKAKKLVFRMIVNE